MKKKFITLLTITAILQTMGTGFAADAISKTDGSSVKILPDVPPIRYEAENDYTTQLSGKAAVEKFETASGGKAVTNISNEWDAVIFKNSPASKLISVSYARGDKGDGLLSLYLNNEYIKDVKFPNTGGWDKYKEIGIELDVPDDGDIKLKFDKRSSAINVDFLDFYQNGLGTQKIPVIVIDTATGLEFDISSGKIVGYKGSSKNLTIPSTIDGVDVVAIGKEAFYKEALIVWDKESGRPKSTVNESLISVTIPNTVKTIENRAFMNVKSLKSIKIPSSVESFGDNAFYGTPWIESQKDEFFVINDVLIKYNGSDTKAVIPKGVKVIGPSSFISKTELQSIIIPSSVLEIGDSAFAYCMALKSITIPDSVKKIGNHAFSNCDELTTVKLPKDIVSIGDGTFQTCLKLKNIVLPQGIIAIGDYAFENCEGLTTLVLPEGVTTIGECAFKDCTNLKSIKIPKSIKKVGLDAFLRSGWYDNVKDPMIIFDNVLYDYIGDEEIVTVPAGVTTIGKMAFNSTNVKSIILPDTVKVIEDSAFSYALSLEKIYLPNSIEKIGDYAFFNSLQLKSITLPNNLKYIGDSAFGGDWFKPAIIEEIIIPASLTDIGTAFRGAKIRKVTIPNTIKHIQPNAFRKSHIRTVYIEDGVESIGNEAFAECDWLVNITIPKSVKNIADDIFRNSYNMNK